MHTYIIYINNSYKHTTRQKKISVKPKTTLSDSTMDIPKFIKD